MTCSRCGAGFPVDHSRCPSCGAAAPTVVVGEPDTLPDRQGPPPRLLRPGARLGPYEVGELLGEGGMSAVYAARDHALHREVAIKVLHPNLVGDAGIRRRFVREGRIARGWAHPNVVPVLDTLVEGDVYALVMERVSAPTLTEVLRRYRDGLPPRELGQVADGLLAGLEAAHARGIVHRDLKPGNVLVEQRDGRLVPRIIDFGIARVLEGTTYTLTGAVLGTCRYMSPEQVRGEPVGLEADLYTFGVVLFELCTGRPPFVDDQPFALMMAHVAKPPPDVAALRPGLPEDVLRCVAECLAKDPTSRPSSATALRERLGAALGVGRVARAPVTGRRPNRHELLLVEAGAFQMGPDRRAVHLGAFSIDRHPVTNGQFLEFLRATGYRPDEPTGFLSHWPSPETPLPSQLRLPVIYVSHGDACAYAGWLGLRLPSEAEWEKAARGTDGRRFPWGRDTPGLEHAWFGQRDGPAPVGERPRGASPCGAEDLAGNVWEWCADEDDPAFYESGPTLDPRRPARADAAAVVVRGGAWLFDDPRALRTWTRASFPPDARLDTVGFRCAG